MHAWPLESAVSAWLLLSWAGFACRSWIGRADRLYLYYCMYVLLNMGLRGGSGIG